MNKLLKCCNKAYCFVNHAHIFELTASGGHGDAFCKRERSVAKQCSAYGQRQTEIEKK